MSKKRVHELGKQLKEQGIELSNQELVEKLHQLGYDVKSHSSSLEDDQAASAYEKILGERKPKPAPVRPSGPGFVVRKRVHTEVAQPAPAAAPPEQEQEQAPAEAYEPEAPVAEAPAYEPEVEQAAAPAEPAGAPEAPAAEAAAAP
ncbi:translation initiation factor IF-2 N-terminal domain-containing protein, partial [Anaeromyxobacter terrae]|uniref:translation initiation factor IF-2 N-terminal domain-containing protein n=1 Tax=Anaeromyxobacter terrae TaxID=2925406 RepID=UPI001F59C365